jgi:phenylacetate-CoA ligase
MDRGRFGSRDQGGVTASTRGPRAWYSRSLDVEALCQEYPPPPDYLDLVHRMSRDALRELQERRFLVQMKRAWEIPFYRRHWSAAGMEAGDIRGLDDLSKIPSYTVYDIRDSIARQPPWGDFMGIDFATDEPMPLVLQTSGGTTSLPRPMLYSPRDREVMNILMGRRLHLQGVRPFDLLQITLAFGLTNAGMSARESAWKYTGAIAVAAGSGASMPTRRQLEIMKEWGVTFLLGFPAYLRHMAQVAREELNIDPKEIGLKALLVHLGVDSRQVLEDLWGAPAYDCYGLHEVGTVAADCEHRSGMHIFEDAYILELTDPDSGALTPAAERGSIVVTTLFRHLAPAIRYDTRDVSAFVPGDCACGGTHRRLERIFGRADHMVKLRGMNVFPEAIGEVVARDARSNGEYVCIVDAAGRNGQDELTVMVEASCDAGQWSPLAETLRRELRASLGVRVAVKVVAAGELDALTGLTGALKVRRLIDRRPAPA